MLPPRPVLRSHFHSGILPFPCRMNDPFADALGDDSDGEFDITGPDVAPLGADALGADERSGSVGAPLGADPLAPRRDAPLGLKRKRLSAQEQSMRKLYPRRKSHIKFEAVK